jgi:hypothetical protein
VAFGKKPPSVTEMVKAATASTDAVPEVAAGSTGVRSQGRVMPDISSKADV